MYGHNTRCHSAGVELCLRWIGRVTDLSNCHTCGKLTQARKVYPTGLKSPQPCAKLMQRAFLLHLQEVHHPCMMLVGLKSCFINLHLVSVVCMQLLNHFHV